MTCSEKLSTVTYQGTSKFLDLLSSVKVIIRFMQKPVEHGGLLWMDGSLPFVRVTPNEFVVNDHIFHKYCTS